MTETARRASSARWKRKADIARAAISAAFEAHGGSISGEWCDAVESSGLSGAAERLGSSPSRVIQRWPVREQAAEALSDCGSRSVRLDEIHVLITDQPDAGWVRVRTTILWSEIAPAAGTWMTDGFIAFDPEAGSLLSVDVEEQRGLLFIETTVIGDGFADLRGCLGERGPAPLPIAGPT